MYRKLLRPRHVLIETLDHTSMFLTVFVFVLKLMAIQNKNTKIASM